MSTISPFAALVRRIAVGPGPVSDAELLTRFVRSADQAAFELLVRRLRTIAFTCLTRRLPGQSSVPPSSRRERP